MALPKDPVKREAYLNSLRTRSIGKKASQETKDKMSAMRKGVQKSEEHKQKIGASHFGLTHTEETKRKIAEGRIGKYCGENHPMFGKTMNEDSRLQMVESNIKTWNNPELKKIISDANSGKNNGSYIDGRWDNYPLFISTRACSKMKEWRRDVFRRDGYTCQITGKKGNLQPHHIKSFSTLMHENGIKTLEEAIACDALWEVSNGISLSKKLHMDLHYKHGKQIPPELLNPTTS
jgi:hypothetical protein